MNRFHHTKYYYVDSHGGWMVVHARNKREARKEGVWEFGRGMVREVRVATEAEIESYENQKGPISETA